MKKETSLVLSIVLLAWIAAGNAWAAPFAYVANIGGNTVSVIDTATSAVIGAPISVGSGPVGVAVNPAGTRVYVVNTNDNSVSVIDTATDTVISAPIPVGQRPWSFGRFIGPAIIPGEGTIGTEMTVPGSGFGSTKGKVLAGNVSVKILTWTDTSIRCLFSKSPPLDTYDVTIQPKGASPIVIENGFTVRAPEIDFTEPTGGSIGEEITVSGFFFGTKKGKVLLGGKTCKVLRWTMDPTTGESEIQVLIPKGLAPGPRELQVTNAVGADTTNFIVE
jgi:YVTN family beta-propeller protein